MHSPETIDWEEARRIAASSKYNCLPEFEAVKAEVETELANLPKGDKIIP